MEIPIDEAFAEPASEQPLELAATALREHGMTVEILDTREDARALRDEILPRDQAPPPYARSPRGASAVAGKTPTA